MSERPELDVRFRQLDSYKNRLQVVAREKHDVDGRFARLVDEHDRLVTTECVSKTGWPRFVCLEKSLR